MRSVQMRLMTWFGAAVAAAALTLAPLETSAASPKSRSHEKLAARVAARVAAARSAAKVRPQIRTTLKAATGSKRTQRKSVVRVVPAAPSFGQLHGLHATDDALDLKSSVALVVDQETDEVLFSKNPEAVLPIA